jgi:hypothetical protein
MVIVDLFLSWWTWKLSKDFFESGHDTLGWIGLVISAANFASALALIF